MVRRRVLFLSADFPADGSADGFPGKDHPRRLTARRLRHPDYIAINQHLWRRYFDAEIISQWHIKSKEPVSFQMQWPAVPCLYCEIKTFSG